MLVLIQHPNSIAELVESPDAPDPFDWVSPWETVVSSQGRHTVEREGKTVEVEELRHELGFSMYRVGTS
jgi:hypothetical protein